MEFEEAKTIVSNVFKEKSSLMYDIYNVFALYYGEENVDNNIDSLIDKVDYSFVDKSKSEDELDEIANSAYESIFKDKSCRIVIHWPKITIQNDRGNKIDIHDLFCTVKIQFITGNLIHIGFRKSTYTKTQFLYGYVHSHLRKMYHPTAESNFYSYAQSYKDDTEFCFGIGPINDTTFRLRRFSAGDADPMGYMLLCRELDICVRVESLKGGPYITMSSLNDGEYKYELVESNIIARELGNIERDFITYYLKNAKLKYVFDGSEYNLGCSFTDFAIDATKMFFGFARQNKDTFTLNDIKISLSDVVKKDGSYYIVEYHDYNHNFMNYVCSNEIEVADFKGKKYFLKIIEDPVDEQAPKMYLLNRNFMTYLWKLVFTIINSNVTIYERTTNNIVESDNIQCFKDEHEEMSHRFII